MSARGRLASLMMVIAAAAASAFAQSAIPPNLTQLRPIQCIAYDPKPSDFPLTGAPPPAYFDSDFFNSDFTAIWGDDGQAGARNDLATFQGAGLNLLHIYNWNPQRTNHKAFLDAAQQLGMKVMIPINNFTAQTITGTTGCAGCGKGYQAAYAVIQGIFNQVYANGTTPHPAAAMWSIYNEYELNGIPALDVAFVAQAILTLEDKAGIPAANRLPITAPVSDATLTAQARRETNVPRTLNAELERAANEWLLTNPGKNVNTPNPPDLPPAVLATIAIADALSDGQNRTTYTSPFDVSPALSTIPPDFWKTRWIASSNPFRFGPDLVTYLTSPAQFQSAWPGTTNFNTLPPLFFGEMGRSQVNSGNDTAKQAADVLGQIQSTAPLARNAGSTKNGYFLGSCFFQHTYVDKARYQAFDTTGTFKTRTEGPQPGTPCPACGQQWRVDALTPLPVWNSVQQGYASAGSAVIDPDLASESPVIVIDLE